MTAPAGTEPAFLPAARHISRIVGCTYCGASPGCNCLELLRGHVHFCRLSRARCQHSKIMTSEMFQDTLNYVLGRDDDVFTQQSDV